MFAICKYVDDGIDIDLASMNIYIRFGDCKAE